MMPEGWKIAYLGDLTCKIGSGLTPKGGKSSYLSTGIPLIRSQNVLWGELDIENTVYISQHQHAKMSHSHVLARDVLLNITGASIGRSCVVPDYISQANVNQHVCIIRANTRLLPDYLSNYLNSWSGQKQIELLQAGGNRQGLNFEQIASLKIPLPPLPEQRRIADILGTWDRAIRLTEQRIAAQQQRKRALMQQLLTGRRRFREFAGREWKPRKIASILAESREPGSNGLSARKITVRLYGKGVVPKEEKLAGSEATKYYKRRAGQFIYSKLDFLNGAFGIIPPEMDGYESTLDLPCFDFKANIDPAFFLYLVSREAFYSRFETYALGGRKARRIQVAEFLSIEIAMPELTEQQRIAAVLQAADSELALLAARRAALQRQKHGLMQQLLTGRVRVPLPEPHTKGADDGDNSPLP
jgi:type I restriction enzyme S subunit